MLSVLLQYVHNGIESKLKCLHSRYCDIDKLASVLVPAGIST
jgi:hypothetical protein